MDFLFAKADESLHTVWGWASIVEDEAGQPVVDLQGDVILPTDLQKAAHDYLLHSRDGGVMHEATGVATIVESLITTPDTIAALFPRIEKGLIPTGWAVAFKVHDESVWKRVLSGELAGFSIHGTGERIPVGDAAV